MITEGWNEKARMLESSDEVKILPGQVGQHNVQFSNFPVNNGIDLQYLVSVFQTSKFLANLSSLNS